MYDYRVTGTAKLGRIARELKAVGDAGLRKELLRGVQDAAKPLKIAEKRSADLLLPSKGGLNRVISRSPIGIRTRLGVNPSVRIVASSKHDIKRMNAGTVRHPVFGNRKRWVTQRIRPGWWDKPIEANQANIRRQVLAALDRISKKLG